MAIVSIFFFNFTIGVHLKLWKCIKKKKKKWKKLKQLPNHFVLKTNLTLWLLKSNKIINLIALEKTPWDTFIISQMLWDLYSYKQRYVIMHVYMVYALKFSKDNICIPINFNWFSCVAKFQTKTIAYLWQKFAYLHIYLPMC